MIKYFAGFLCFVAATAMCLSLPPLPIKGGPSSNLGKSAGTHELVWLGQVNNKTYYADNTGNMNWTQAKALCESQDMALATVETAAENKFLSGAYTPGVFDIYYWTAAQDSQLLSQLRWKKGEEDQVEIREEIALWLTDFVTPPLSCGVVASFFDSLWMYMIPCAHEEFVVGTLCQTV